LLAFTKFDHEKIFGHLAPPCAGARWRKVISWKS